ncbi:MAG TPA: ATP-grasp domain-containing protein [Candidatus Saccharimonadales bacterium]|nr:ATP-grasp domain-containing protein [Candidatus Saccharimonadales bacterium]
MADQTNTTTNYYSHILILDAHTRQSLVLTRNLGKKNITIAALTTFEKTNVPVFHSKWCDKKIISPFSEGTDEYISFLISYLKSNKVDLIIPSSDGTITALSKHRKRIEKYAPLALTQDKALKIASNKEKTLSIAKKIGIKIPKSISVFSKTDIKNALKLTGLPAVVKPSESWVDDKNNSKRLSSVLVTTEKEAIKEATDLLKDGGKVIVQQYLNGRREAVSMIYSKGKVYGKFAQWAKRVQPPLGGQSILRQSIKVPSDIGDQAEQLIKTIQLDGYSETEFRRDDKGVPYLMEINPRLSASVEIAVESGVDYPFLIYQLGRGKAIKQTFHYKTGNWMRHLGGDIITSLEAIKNYGKPGISSPAKTIIDFFVSFFTPISYDYIDFGDPFPAFYAIIGFFQGLPALYRSSRNK